MAKQRVLDEDWIPKAPKKVQDAADEYESAHKSHQRTKTKLNAATENVVAAMVEAGVKVVAIRNGEKMLKLTDLVKVKIEKPKQHEHNGDGETNGLSPRRRGRPRKGEVTEPQLAEETA